MVLKTQQLVAFYKMQPISRSMPFLKITVYIGIYL
jgi:hypothetical protein